MRTKINPYKRINKNISLSVGMVHKAKVPKKVTVCMLTHIPNETGYYNERLEILKITLDSLRKNTDPSMYDLLVVNNGSNEKTAEYLQSQQKSGRIDYLLSSQKNLGVCNALSILLSTGPGEYVCWIPDDVLFLNGWLEKSLELAETFPDVGFVTPCPNRNSYKQSYNKAHLSVYENRKDIIRHDPEWDKQWDEIWCHSVGTNLNDFIKNNSLDGLKLLEVNGVKAYPMGAHFVALMKKTVANQIVPFTYTDRLMGGAPDDPTALINALDQSINDLGLVKLTTNGCYVEHLGNKIDERIRKLIQKNNKEDREAESVEEGPVSQLKLYERILLFLFKLPLLRSLPKKLNHFSEKLIYIKSMHRVKS